MVEGCVALLRGAAVKSADADTEGEGVDAELVVALGGPPAAWALTNGEPGPDYWLRVWALRGLLWAWQDTGTPVVLEALRDDAWRVREMAARVTARHHVVDALPILAQLQDDPLPRVVRAAERAMASLTAVDG